MTTQTVSQVLALRRLHYDEVSVQLPRNADLRRGKYENNLHCWLASIHILPHSDAFIANKFLVDGVVFGPPTEASVRDARKRRGIKEDEPPIPPLPLQYPIETAEERMARTQAMAPVKKQQGGFLASVFGH